jgi:hypothetical protein
MLLGNCPIKFVRGESYLYSIIFDDIDSEVIESVSINSKKLNFNIELEKDNSNKGRWFYTFSPEETARFAPNRTTYTLIVKCKGAELETQKLPNQDIDVVADENCD